MSTSSPWIFFSLIFSCSTPVALFSTPAVTAEIVDTFGQSIDEQADKLVEKAKNMRIEAYVDTYDPQGAAKILEEITSKFPNYYRAFYNLGLTYYAIDPKNSKKYLPAFKTAIKIEEENPIVQDGSIYNTLGWIYLNDKDYKTAEKYLLIALSRSKTNKKWTNSAINYNLGRMYFENQDYTDAISYLKTAISDYGNPAAENLLGIVLELSK